MSNQDPCTAAQALQIICALGDRINTNSHLSDDSTHANDKRFRIPQKAQVYYEQARADFWCLLADGARKGWLSPALLIARATEIEVSLKRGLDTCADAQARPNLEHDMAASQRTLDKLPREIDGQVIDLSQVESCLADARTLNDRRRYNLARQQVRQADEYAVVLCEINSCIVHDLKVPSFLEASCDMPDAHALVHEAIQLFNYRKLSKCRTKIEEARKLAYSIIGKSTLEHARRMIEALPNSDVLPTLLARLQQLCSAHQRQDLDAAVKGGANLVRDIEEYQKQRTGGPISLKDLSDRINSLTARFPNDPKVLAATRKLANLREFWDYNVSQGFKGSCHLNRHLDKLERRMTNLAADI